MKCTLRTLCDACCVMHAEHAVHAVQAMVERAATQAAAGGTQLTEDVFWGALQARRE